MPRPSRMIDIDLVNSLFSYDPSTGVLSNKEIKNKVHNTCSLIDHSGYVRIYIDSRPYQAHRIIWCIVYGEQPEYIDHINGVRSDNRLCNLRNCTERENMQNQKVHREGKILGATYCKEKNKWRAKLQLNGVRVHIGYYDTEEEAHAAYCDAVSHIERYDAHKPREKKTKTPVGITYNAGYGLDWVVRKQINGKYYYIGKFPSLNKAKKALNSFIAEMESTGVLRG